MPTNEFLGLPLSEVQPQIIRLIKDACGGSPCIGLRIEPEGSMDPNGRSRCAKHVTDIPGNVWEEIDVDWSDEPWSIPVLYVRRGGTVTLGVELWCDETVPGATPSPEPTVTSPSTDRSESPEPGPDQTPSSDTTQ